MCYVGEGVHLSRCYEPVAKRDGRPVLLGEGGQGSVELWKQRVSGKLVAVKKNHSSSGCGFMGTQDHEARVLQDLGRHPCLANVLEYFDASGTTVIISEFYCGGDLQTVIDAYRKHDERVEQAFIWHVFRQMAEAVAFIHHRGVTHRDIKPANVFLDWHPRTPRDRCYPHRIVLGDFGIAAVNGANDRSGAGTLAYQPPERPLGGEKADVWGIGATIHSLAHNGKLCVRDPPASVRKDREAISRWYANGDNRRICSVSDKYSDQLDDFMHSCLRFHRANRIDSWRLAEKLAGVARAIVRNRFRPLQPFARRDLQY